MSIDQPEHPASQLPPPYVTALVVDDERISRRVATRMLRELGLRVLEADGAEEALDVFRISQHPIDLVLLDVVMPETDGVELAEQILAHRPGQRIIFMSAYSAEVLAEHGLQDLEVLFLAKPYTMEELRAKVRQAMERPPSPREDPVWRARQQER
jgi:CheY-like chemotaxis protein